MSWIHFFALGWGVPLSVYAVLQACALEHVRGAWRIALATPVPPMALVSGHMLWGAHEERSLWPMTMLMTAPGAILALVVMWTLALLSSRRWRALVRPAGVCVSGMLWAGLGAQGIGVLWSGQTGVRVAWILVACGLTVGLLVRGWRRRTLSCS